MHVLRTLKTERNEELRAEKTHRCATNISPCVED
jgi:hypothetical protein